MKDSPAIILASGLAGLLAAALPTADGWILEQSLHVMGTELSLQSLGLFTVSLFLYLPSLVLTVVGAITMKPRFAKRGLGILAVLSALGALAAWLLQKATIDQLSVVGVGPSIGLFLLLVSGLGGLLGGGLLAAFPPKAESQKA